jgi:16S rRNA (adenine1518-N6/adenine1519-N6)-dimethyltransferase
VFRRTGIDPGLRGEMLGITEFAALAGAGMP